MQRAGLILLLAAGNALAHPGHENGWLSASLAHLLSEPDHLAILLGPLVLGIVWVVRSKSKAEKRIRD